MSYHTDMVGAPERDGTISSETHLEVSSQQAQSTDHFGVNCNLGKVHRLSAEGFRETVCDGVTLSLASLQVLDLSANLKAVCHLMLRFEI